ncbi:TetR/AcrR family transcriptional regulator [Catenuloplanes indicus]|uniref:AcrR family transcriptional regulator n=1 Tax=Catenuloplanes indicus TaxID=137267 RepID=A0AAE3VU54_9ACTN|nr:TetR/AcrR family transcriptional regulator [Catenuloplanes indicus]MDQ0363761.1 AcrR family transcriptional regulator [Catenuloplanes indicus]
MGRWEPDARQRLEQAALELFAEQGFAATTVPQITARAGLTTRTFFRHFADKREVLFAEDQAAEAAEQLLITAPPGTDPLTLILDGLRAVATARFEPKRAHLRALREIIRTDDGLRERELRKRGILREVVRTGFLARGLPATTAALLAETGTTLLFVSVDEWLDRDDSRPLADIIDDTLTTLRAVLKT